VTAPIRTLDEGAASVLAERDPKLARAIALCGPVAIPGRPATLHSLCTAVIGQQLSMASARAISARFTARFGDGHSLDPAELLRAPEEDLRGLGLSRGKMETIRAAAAHWRDTGLTPERLAAMPDDAVIETLTAIRGIGPWTAKMVLIFSLRRADVLPHEDLGVRVGMRALYRMRDEPERDRIEKVAEAWRPYRTVGAWYCWRWLDRMKRPARKA
jgi:DNA-3-methyladenine glycosylase II